jgi:cellobiose-specific phosphotransferase system component IIB
MAQVPIDVLAPTRSLINLDSFHNGNFSIGDDFKLSFVFDDIVLVEFIDEVSDGKGDVVMRGNIFVPTNALVKAWRKAVVVLVGPSVKYCKPNDIVIFPNDKGASVSNIEIEGYGKLRKGVFLNEQRLFGVCKRSDKPAETAEGAAADIVNESSTTRAKRNAKK